MKSLVILKYLLDDARASFLADTSRDWTTIQSRQKTEGESFLTITLPLFADWFFRSIDEGRVVTTMLPPFALRREGGRSLALPSFLFGITSRVFDSEDGHLLLDHSSSLVDVNACLFVRQVCYLFKKTKLSCTRKRVNKALNSYIETDVLLKESDRRMKFSRFDLSIANRVLADITKRYFESDQLPKHGPGATFQKIVGNVKFKNRDFYRRWDGVFSWEELYGFSNDPCEGTGDDYIDDHPVIRVIDVPKTMKGPRIIGVEPVAMQFAQQLVSARLVESFNSSSYRACIRFADQTRNQSLALQSSVDRSMATIDLSEASDRISCKLVRVLFARQDPRILRQLFATRSPKALVKQYNSELKLRKFASMGSAVTFPLESIVFLVLVSIALVKDGLTRGIRPSATLKLVREKVSIFGDDIIVPAESFRAVTDGLEAYGLKVNRQKSFCNGFFRESCGVDAIQGYNITPVYVRRLLPDDSRSSAESIVSTVSLSNQMFLAGHLRTADFLARNAGKRFDLVGRDSPILGLHTRQNVSTFGSYNRNLHRFELRGYKVATSTVINRIDGYDALLKHQLSRVPNEDADHLNSNVKANSLCLRKSSDLPY